MGRIYLEPRDPLPLPEFATHAAWCQWLWVRGCLSPGHRGCRSADRCIAHYAQATGDSWRYERREA